MKAILEFHLPEDEEEFKEAIYGRQYYCALWELKELKHRISKSPEEYTVDSIKQCLNDIIPNSIYD